MIFFLNENQKSILNDYLNFQDNKLTLEKFNQNLEGLEYLFKVVHLGRKDKMNEDMWNLIKSLADNIIPKDIVKENGILSYKESKYNEINSNAKFHSEQWHFIKDYLLKCYEPHLFKKEEKTLLKKLSLKFGKK